jgi:hypothetical protein
MALTNCNTPAVRSGHDRWPHADGISSCCHEAGIIEYSQEGLFNQCIEEGQRYGAFQ